MKKLLSILLLTLLVVGLAGTSPAQASGRCYVNIDANGDNNGTSWTHAYTNLQSALSDTCTEIWIAAGKYTPGINPEDTFALKSGIAVYGGFAGAETALEQRDWVNNPTILSGDLLGNDTYTSTSNHDDLDKSDNAHRVVTIASITNTTLDGFIIEGGAANGPIASYDPNLGNEDRNRKGAGIYNFESNPTLRNLVIRNNYAQVDGGGMHNFAGSPSLINVRFESNKADKPDSNSNGYGGGMHSERSSPSLTNVHFENNYAIRGGALSTTDGVSPKITDGKFIGNRANSGGAIFNNTNSNLELTNIEFKNNVAALSGGAIYNRASNPSINKAFFINNTSSAYGGALFYLNTQGTSSITNAVFSKNETYNAGGAIYLLTEGNISKTVIDATNVTFYANKTAYVGGIDGGAIANQNSTLTVTNSILWANQSQTDEQPIFSQITLANSGTAIVTYSIIQDGWDGIGNLNADPRFINPSNGELRLQSNSPAIDNGTNLSCPSHDVEGTSRPQQGYGSTAICDMGAYEYTNQPTTETPNGISINRVGQTPTNSSSVVFNVLFASTVTNLDTNDFKVVHISPNGTLNGTNISNLTGSGVNYQVTINTGSGNGALRLQIPSNATVTGINNNILPYTSPQSYFLARIQTFEDVNPSTHWAWAFIERLYAENITGGCRLSPLAYCPEDQVTRAQMAVFLEKAIKGASFAPPTNVPISFGDTTDHWARYWIEALKKDGITSGCGDGSNYCPETPANRAQMAVFLLKAKYGSKYAPPAVGESTGFSDVPTSHWAAAWIKQLAAEGITGGFPDGTYRPDGTVTRAQMAVFLVNTFKLP